VINRRHFLFFIRETPTVTLDVIQSMADLLRGYAEFA
jgi:hypothetical protein